MIHRMVKHIDIRHHFPKAFNLSRYTIIVFVALFIVATANNTFFKKATDLYPFVENFGFITALSFLVLALLVLLMAILSLVIPVRPLSAIFILIAAVSSYFADSFGTVIDTDMIRNTLETDVAEAGDLFSWVLFYRIVFFALLPIAILYCLPLKKETLFQKAVRSLALGIGAIAISTFCILSNGSQFASFLREHKPVRYYINPSYPIYSVGRYINDSFSGPKDKSLILLNAEVWKEEPTKEKNNLVIMVVGETARADHFSLNGYERETNEFTSHESQLISYSNISACGTSTAVSVPCMFSYQGRSGFNVKKARRTENVLDLLQLANVSVLWRDNNSDSKGMAERIPYEDFQSTEKNSKCDTECRDIGMLDNLSDYISDQNGDILIVLHQMGSHGPAYYKRYPQEFAKYQPTCDTAEFSECTQEEIINAYDNSIRYTDYFLSKVISFLKTNKTHDTTMLYVSDHGESLGEGGLYLHGLPYSFAPKSQTEVPVLLWTNSDSQVNMIDSNKLKHTPNSHDSVFDTLLTLFSVKTSLPPSSSMPLLVMDRNETNIISIR